MTEDVQDVPPAPIELRSHKSGVCLKSFSIDDAQELFDLFEKDRRESPIHSRPVTTYKSTEAVKNLIVCDEEEGRTRFSIRNSKDELIGTCYVQLFKTQESKPKIAEIGYYFGRDYLGQNDAIETVQLLCAYGFDNLKLDQIQIVENKENTESLQILGKVGFIRSEISPLTGRSNEKYSYHSLTSQKLVR